MIQSPLILNSGEGCEKSPRIGIANVCYQDPRSVQYLVANHYVK